MAVGHGPRHGVPNDIPLHLGEFPHAGEPDVRLAVSRLQRSRVVPGVPPGVPAAMPQADSASTVAAIPVTSLASSS